MSCLCAGSNLWWYATPLCASLPCDETRLSFLKIFHHNMTSTATNQSTSGETNFVECLQHVYPLIDELAPLLPLPLRPNHESNKCRSSTERSCPSLFSSLLFIPNTDNTIPSNLSPCSQCRPSLALRPIIRLPLFPSRPLSKDSTKAQPIHLVR